MIDIDTLSIDQLEQLRDACNRRILQMRRTHGLALPDLLRLLEEVKLVLHDQGKEWHSLERWQWMDGEVRFWVNPKDQDIYRTGWFSIDDLIGWSHDRGVIVVEEELDEDFDEAPWQESLQISWMPQNHESEESEHEPVLVEIF